MGVTALGLLVDGLAVYRLTRLATKDTIFDGPRDLIVQKAYERTGRLAELVELTDYDGDGPIRPGALADAVPLDDFAPKLATLVTCRWCAGVWVGFAAVAARAVAPKLWDPFARALAVASVAPLLAGFEDG